MMCGQQPKTEEKTRKASEKQRMPKIVDLSGMYLNSLPNPSLNLGTIRELNLSNNNLQRIPESLIARLLNVVVLDLHSNQLESLPNSIGCLSKLEVLNISGNLIGILPKTIENCGRLKEVNANFNKLRILPDTLGFSLPHLKTLSVNSNKLTFLPQSLPCLTSLRVLDARLNNLRALPEHLETLINLRTLNISQNFHHLRTLPASLGLLPSLVELDASYNQIAELPTSIGCLHGLQKLSVEGNPMESPPAEVRELGVAAVKEFLCEKMQGNGKKKKTWVKKIVRFGTFNRGGVERREGLVVSEYVDGLASPRVLGRFSPRRMFSNRGFFT